MKNIFTDILRVVLIISVLAFNACKPDDPTKEEPPVVEDTKTDGITNFVDAAKGRSISSNGETLSCVLTVEAPYVANLNIISGGDNWVAITKGQTGEAGRNTFRLVFEKNETQESRSVEVLVQVEGYDQVSLVVYEQKPDQASAQKKLNEALNSYMHERLKQEYLWEEYKGLNVDLTVDYTEFLNTHLTMLGDINAEDGGKYRANSGKKGRFIYSNIQEVAPLTKAYETVSLGFGPLFSSTIDAYNDVVGLTIAYVHQGSPAWAAGMRRGDTIYNVNGVVLRSSNYKDYMTALYYSPSGTYNFQFIRDADMNNRFEATVSVDLYRYNPVLYSAIMTEGSHNIGYLVLENFDLDAQDFVVDILQQFKDNSITDLILDLRFNPGGAVAQSRYIASAIAGTSHLDAIFVNVDFRGNKKQSWKFRGGPNDEDGLGIAPDLGLSRLFVIGSESTASASELIINGLRGIDFPVYLYGSRTEGKNVGMTTTRTTYDNRTFLFSPITFRVSNAKGFGDYPDGIAPDVMVNNQNSSYADDADNVFPYSFGDWGNMGFNVALRYAYEDILGISRSQSVRQQSSESEFKPLEFCAPAEYKIGRYGNVIYKMED